MVPVHHDGEDQAEFKATGTCRRGSSQYSGSRTFGRARADIQRPAAGELLPPSRTLMLKAPHPHKTPHRVNKCSKHGRVETVQIQTITLPDPSKEGSHSGTNKQETHQFGESILPCSAYKHIGMISKGWHPSVTLNKCPSDHPHSPH